MKKKSLILMIISSAVIIMILSFNALFMVVSPEQRELAIGQLGISYDDYISIVLANYFFNLTIPMVFALYSLYEFKKNEISTLYIFVWLILNCGALAYVFYSQQIFKMAAIICYIANALLLINLYFNNE